MRLDWEAARYAAAAVPASPPRLAGHSGSKGFVATTRAAAPRCRAAANDALSDPAGSLDWRGWAMLRPAIETPGSPVPPWWAPGPAVRQQRPTIEASGSPVPWWAPGPAVRQRRPVPD